MRRYANTIREDIKKCHVDTIEPHDSRSRTDHEWYLLYHPVINPKESGKVRRVNNRAAMFHGTSLNIYLLVGPEILQSLISVLSTRTPSNRIQSACFSMKEHLTKINLRFDFCGGNIPHRMW